MTSTAVKVETLLGEFRIMVPALASLLGFQLVAAFQSSFHDLPALARVANFLGVLCTALALAMLLVPAGYHRFTNKVDESPDFVRFTRHMMGVAFVFFPIGLVLSIYVQAVRTFDDSPMVPAVALALLAIFIAAWWIVPWARARRLEGK
ncbi:MAG: DUF6328 family protein [Thermoplasmatota archaeon]|nr:DUF6328 family protein [Halobacteriales archaeon]